MLLMTFVNPNTIITRAITEEGENRGVAGRDCTNWHPWSENRTEMSHYGIDVCSDVCFNASQWA